MLDICIDEYEIEVYYDEDYYILDQVEIPKHAFMQYEGDWEDIPF